MTYQKTNSKIHIIQNEYDASNGKLLEDTLLTSPEKLVEVGVPAKDIKKSSSSRTYGWYKCSKKNTRKRTIYIRQIGSIYRCFN